MPSDEELDMDPKDIDKAMHGTLKET